MQKHAVVKDATGEEKPLENMLNQATNNSNLGYNNDVGEVLKDNLDIQEKYTMAQVEEGKINSSKTENTIKGKKAKLYDSTVLRVVENIGDNSTKIIDKATGKK